MRVNNMAARVCTPLIDEAYGIYIEDYFAELLRVERKRTERSKTPFLLMLFDVSRLGEFDNASEAKRNTIKAINSLVREIDVIGWYTYDTIVGILFREMKKGHAYSPLVRERILRRMYHYLNENVERKIIEQIFVSFHSFPESDVNIISNTPLDLNLYPDMSLMNEKPATVFSFFLKTVMDLLGSILGIVILSPALILIAILVRSSSKGPFLFKQERIGLFGKPFTLLKFRTMYVDKGDDIHKEFVAGFIKGKVSGESQSEEQAKVYKLTKDPRITPIGKILRATSLDELPQLFNVVRGEMSLVGPRPPVPYEYEQYDIWHKGRLVRFRPGITGLWQVEGRSSTSFDEMVRLDLKYMKEWSLWLDIKIILKTPWIALTGRGGY
jgi:lipopolysaccharide/colanic/teichoic acid biosynthesis glycosyltransferase